MLDMSSGLFIMLSIMGLFIMLCIISGLDRSWACIALGSANIPPSDGAAAADDGAGALLGADDAGAAEEGAGADADADADDDGDDEDEGTALLAGPLTM